MYNLFQFLHVLSAVVWVGAAVLATYLSIRLGSMRDNPVAGPAAGLMEKSAVPVFMVAAFGTLITGLILAFGWIGFEPLWIKIGLVGVILSIVVGMTYFKPHGEKLEAAMKERGPSDPSVQAMIRQATLVSMGEMVVFAIVIWAMVVKP